MINHVAQYYCTTFSYGAIVVAEFEDVVDATMPLLVVYPRSDSHLGAPLFSTSEIRSIL